MNRRALILAPHPDDESITGLLPLRLQEESGFEIWVVPVTLGSRADRRAARKRELQAACATLGFRLRWPNSLSGGTVQIHELKALLQSMRPALVVLPHARDGHPAHRATHRLGVAAMDAARRAFHVAETEYWHPLERPNLMVSADDAHLQTLGRALACHEGEIARNDYAARLPAWMIDNVRRGAERVGGVGSVAPEFAYATLYRIRRRSGRKWTVALRGGWIIESSEDLGALVARWGTAGKPAP